MSEFTDQDRNTIQELHKKVDKVSGEIIAISTTLKGNGRGLCTRVDKAETTLIKVKEDVRVLVAVLTTIGLLSGTSLGIGISRIVGG